MRLVFYEPLIWIRIFRLIQQLYFRNDVETGCIWKLSDSKEMWIFIYSNKHAFEIKIPSQGFKCFDSQFTVLPIFMKNLPIDYMLSFLQQYESMLQQKAVSAVGLVWEWIFDMQQMVQYTAQLCSCDWGQYSTLFTMNMYHNDTMKIVHPHRFNKNHHVNNSNSNDVHNNNSNNISSIDSTIANTDIQQQQTVLYAQENNIVNIHNNKNNNHKTEEDGNYYWNHFVQMISEHQWIDVYNKSISCQLPTGIVRTERIEIGLPVEFHRMVGEWMILVPKTQISWESNKAMVTAGSNSPLKQMCCGNSEIPYSAHVFCPADKSKVLHPFTVYLNAQNLEDIYRLLNAVPSSTICSMYWVFAINANHTSDFCELNIQYQFHNKYGLPEYCKLRLDLR